MSNTGNLLEQLSDRMDKAVEHMKHEFATIRTGKASPSLVEHITIEYYGTTVKLKEMAGITTPEARLLVIQPYDPSSVGTIEKAIRASNIGINPVSDGKILRLPIPELSQERRAILSKQVSSKAEETRVGIRNVRREGNELAKKAQKATEITEDELEQMLKDIQELTDASIADVDKVLAAKEKELMQI
ncbi:MAG TPA: ribosome recycling factor [Lentisphaeria bacterium]|nr:MAG: ribosome recycling factor [Lentisphaerae bacterium GWF2_38_69]HBM15893.1 ribosome recycling factor [Lentisphaeria bacterium]